MGSHWPGPPLLNVLFSYRPTERAGLTTRHLTGTADPSQEYNLRDLSSSKDERIRQTLNLIERMPAALTSTAFDIYASLVLTLSSKSSSSCLFLNGVTSGGCHFSLGLSLILKEVAGESGWLRPLLALRPAFGAEHLSLVFFFFFPCPNHAYCSPGSKHFWKGAARPSFSVHDAAFQGSVYLAAASVSSSQPLAGTIPSPPYSLLLSFWRWASHCIRTSFSRLEAGARLWSSKAQKVRWGLTFLYLNLPPTTLLPCSSARCSMQGTSGRLSGPKWVGEERIRGEVHRFCPQKAEQCRESSRGHLAMPSICLVIHLIGWGGQAQRLRGRSSPWAVAKLYHYQLGKEY